MTSIGNYAFISCDHLTGAYFMGNAPSMGTGCFDATGDEFTVYYFNGKTGFTSPNMERLSGG